MALHQNMVLLIGNVTRDLELKQTSNGKSIVHFTVATNREYGEKKYVDFVPVCAWGKWAEIAAATLRKGDGVVVEGRVDVSNYEQDGKRRMRIEIVAENLGFLKRRTEQAASAPAPIGGPEDAGQGEEAQ